jgi:hypothetical protein
MSINETITETINAITPTGVLWWMKILMIIGFVALFKTLLDQSINIVYFAAYIVGILKWLIAKIKRRDLNEDV